jgi:hypothetical protein
MKTFEGLPVPGYRAQGARAVGLVTAMKEREEALLRILDALAEDGEIDRRWLQIGRTRLEQAFMAIDRAIFRPARVTLASDRREGADDAVPRGRADLPGSGAP